MESKTRRTLVKSAPELWELADDLARMEAWMGGLVGTTHPVAIEITDRDPERILGWRSADPGSHARIALELAEEQVRHRGRDHGPALPGPTPGDAIAALDGLLDELGSPERRPFVAGWAPPRAPSADGLIESASRCEGATRSPTKLAHLRELREQGIHSSSAEACREAAREGQADRAQADREAARPGSFEELDTFVRHRTHDFDMDKSARTATRWSPATARSTGARCSSSARTSPSSAARWAR